MSRSTSAKNACHAADARARRDRRRGCGCSRSHSRSSLPVRLMKTVSSVVSFTATSVMVKPCSFGVRDHVGKRRAAGAHVREHGAVDDARAVDAGHRGEVASRAPARSPVALDAQLGVGARARLQLLGRVEREQLAVVDDRDPLAELVGLFHVVRGEHDRLALRVELVHDVPQREAALRVEARRSARRGRARRGRA